MKEGLKVITIISVFVLGVIAVYWMHSPEESMIRNLDHSIEK